MTEQKDIREMDEDEFFSTVLHKHLHDPNLFYDHGNNPAYKNLMKYAQNNNRHGCPEDWRTLVTRKRKWFLARGLEDFYERDLAATTSIRSMMIFAISTFFVHRCFESKI